MERPKIFAGLLVVLVFIVLGNHSSFSEIQPFEVSFNPLEKIVYGINEKIELRLVPENMNGKDVSKEYDLIMVKDGRRSMYWGELIFPIILSFAQEGEYSVFLRDKSGRDMSSLEFVVSGEINSDKKEFSQKKEGNSYPSLRINSNKLQKGEELVVQLVGGNINNPSLELFVVHKDKSFKLLELSKEIRFAPSENGEYFVQLRDSGKIIDEASFFVGDKAGDVGLQSGKQTNKQFDKQSEKILGEEKALTLPSFGQEKKLATIPIKIKNHAGQSKQVRGEYGRSFRGEFIDVLNPTNKVNKIRFHDLKLKNLDSLRMEDIDNKEVWVNRNRAVQSFAIDPRGLNFSFAQIELEASGNALYKCQEYDFDAQECLGGWQKDRDIVPGENYTIMLTPEDPLYSEVNTSVGCSCSDSVNQQNSGSLSCSTFCPFTLNIPQDATSFFLEEMIINVTITVNADGCTMSNAQQSGDFDHDQNHDDGDEATIGSGSYTSTTSVSWTNSSIEQSGSRSFTNLDCSNWPDYCTYYIYIDSSMDFQAPGRSRKSPSMSISVDGVNYTINYTEPGAFSVSLDSPDNNYRTNASSEEFTYTPSNEEYSISNCSIYTNETSWSAKNTTYSITNGSQNTIIAAFNNEGHFAWNVECWDSNGNSATSPTNRTIIIDRSGPDVSLVLPSNGDTYTDSNVVPFVYNVSDDSGIDNCTLYVNGSGVKTDTSITKNQNQTINHNLDNGDYSWYVRCVDEAGNANQSSSRSLTVSVIKPIYYGNWFESSTSDCSSFPCEISLEQGTDGTQNSVSGTIAASSSELVVEAESPFMGANGAEVSSSGDVLFSTYFQTSDTRVEVSWWLYILNSSDEEELICSNTVGTASSSGAATTGSCNPSSDKRLLSTDKLYYEIELTNTHPAQSRDFVHLIDHISSFVNVTGFTQLGTLEATKTAPSSKVYVDQGNSLTLSCQVNCTDGTCLSTNVTAQTNASGSWSAISGSGIISLNGSETNPHAMGDVFNTSNSTSFGLNASSPGSTYIRCAAQSKYSTSYTEAVEVSVASTEAPEVNLSSPKNNSWVNSSSVTLEYIPSSYSQIDNCSLYINGIFNQTNSSPINNGGMNNFTLSSLEQRKYNWSVSCQDTSSRVGNSSTWYLKVDYEGPYLIELNKPIDDWSTTSPDIEFNWTAYDNRAANMSCDLRINGTRNTTITAYNATPATTTIEGFEIGYYIWDIACQDLANNTNTSETRSFNISDEPPQVSLYSPENESGTNETSVELTYNASDNFALDECELYINGIYNQSNQSVLINGLNNFSVSFDETEYNWSVTCYDNNGNNASTGNATLYVDLTKPYINLQSPGNDAYFTDSEVAFSYTPTDNYDTLNCTLYVDGVENDTSIVSSGNQYDVTLDGYKDGVHYWNVSCTDIGGNINYSETRNFTINQTPVVEPISPSNNTHTNQSNVLIEYNISDNDDIEGCSLYINSTFNQSNSTNVLKGQTNNFTLSSPAEAEYNWFVKCNDSGVYGNSDSSDTWRFIVDRTGPTISLNLPENDYTINTTVYTFNWTAADNFATGLLCNLSINDSVNGSNIESNNGVPALFNVTGLRNGDFNWSVSCVDNATNTNISETRNFTVLLSPRVNLTSPEDGDGDLFHDVSFKYIPSLGSENFTNCTLMLNGQENETKYDINAKVENNFTVTLPDGRYNWNVKCYDTNNLSGMAPENWTYYVDSEEPFEIELTYPENDSTVARNNVSFKFIPKDKISDELSCDVYLTDEGSTYSIGSDLNTTNGTEYTYYYILNDGTYNWSVDCTDKAGNFNVSDTWFFDVEAPPNVTLVAPDNESWFNETDVNLTYFPSDDILITGCALYINGSYNRTASFVLNKQNNTFEMGDLAQGAYLWSVQCNDSDGNSFMPTNKTFYVDNLSPQISLNSPINSEELDSSSVLFNWTASDNLATELSCDLWLNDSLNVTDITSNNGAPTTFTIEGMDDGDYNWSIFCRDNALNENQSNSEDFAVQEPPKVSLGNPIANYRNNSVNVTLYFTATDNSGNISLCTLILNSEANETNAGVESGVEASFNLYDLPNGSYTWDVNCSDPNSNTGTNGSSKSFYVDLEGPSVELHHPSDDQLFNQNDILFNWTATDFNSSVEVSCDLFISDPEGDILEENITSFSGEVSSKLVKNLSDGEHFWNVSCTDDLNNTDYSVTWRFVVNQPDLYINASLIGFNNTNPSINDTINITANVSNIGGIDASNVEVEFWDGRPDDGGSLIGSDQKNVAYNDSSLFYIEWNITEGMHVVFVSADPSNSINELNESNNNATLNISVLWVEWNSPENESVFNSSNVDLNFTLHDYTGGAINYSIYVNDMFSGEEGEGIDGVSENISVNLNEGLNTIFVEGLDYLDRRKNSSELYITLDTNAPTSEILTANESWFNISAPNISIRIIDSLDSILNYTLYINGSSENQGYVSNNSIENITLNTQPDGEYLLVLEGEDDASNKENSSSKIIYIDTEKPSIELNYPPNQENFSTSDVSLNYTVYDNLASVADCYITLDGEDKGLSNVNVGEENSYLATDLSEGEHLWNVTCFDEANNSNTSETRIFNVFFPPVIEVTSPKNLTWSNQDTNTFRFNVTDDTGIENCSIVLNGAIKDTKFNIINNSENSFTVSGMNNTNIWQIECYDNSSYHAYGISSERVLYVDLVEPSSTITTVNHTWFNSNPSISFILEDNMANPINYTVYVNDSFNSEGNSGNNSEDSANLLGLQNGTYEIKVEAKDNALNAQNSSSIIVYYDTVEPSINLTYPENDSSIDTDTTNLNFSVEDNMAESLICNLTLDGEIIEQNILVLNGSEENVSVVDLEGGPHYWNVSCIDNATNIGQSETYLFYSPYPDLEVNSSNIFFSDDSPSEGSIVNITATVFNIGGGDAKNITVQFWENEIGGSGSQIGSNQTINLTALESENVSVEYTAELGTNDIFVVVDPSNEIEEENETNNNASKSITVEFWHYAGGETNDTITLEDEELEGIFQWQVANSTGSNIYVSDYDADVNWQSLQALGRDTSGNERIEDFGELDNALNSSTFFDSVNATYLENGNPKETIELEVYNQEITNIPVVNSTNSTSFKTGILWDFSDGGTTYSEVQDVIFLTVVNKSQQGYNETRDFEIRIPATLGQLVGPDNDKVAFYTEIK